MNVCNIALGCILYDLVNVLLYCNFRHHQSSLTIQRGIWGKQNNGLVKVVNIFLKRECNLYLPEMLVLASTCQCVALVISTLFYGLPLTCCLSLKVRKRVVGTRNAQHSHSKNYFSYVNILSIMNGGVVIHERQRNHHKLKSEPRNQLMVRNVVSSYAWPSSFTSNPGSKREEKHNNIKLNPL